MVFIESTLVIIAITTAANLLIEVFSRIRKSSCRAGSTGVEIDLENKESPSAGK